MSHRFVVSQFILFGALILLALGVTALASQKRTLTPGSPHGPELVGCPPARETACAAKAHATYVVALRHVKQIAPRPGFISSRHAIQIARKVPQAYQGTQAPASAHTHAVLLRSLADAGRLDPGLAQNDTAGKHFPIWVVTIHAPILDREGVRYFPVYTVVLDARDGTVRDDCAGCDSVE